MSKFHPRPLSRKMQRFRSQRSLRTSPSRVTTTGTGVTGGRWRTRDDTPWPGLPTRTRRIFSSVVTRRHPSGGSGTVPRPLETLGSLLHRSHMSCLTHPGARPVGVRVDGRGNGGGVGGRDGGHDTLVSPAPFEGRGGVCGRPSSESRRNAQ